MSGNPNGSKQFIIALAVALGGVAVGSFVVIKMDLPGQSQRSFFTRAKPSLPEHTLDSPTNGMVWISGGIFWMGSAGGNPDERPVHKVAVDGFWMDKTEVSNEQFEEFVRATGYLTIAERSPDPRDFPGATAERLVPGSVVFNPPAREVSLENHYLWWKWTPGASWRHPEGP